MDELYIKMMKKETNELIDKLTSLLDDKNKIIEEQYKLNERYKSEYYKDDLIKSLIDKVDGLTNRLNKSFFITPEESDRIGKWKDKHVKEKHNGNSYCGAIGGRYTYEFIPTSIGCIGTIKCECGECFTFKDLE